MNIVKVYGPGCAKCTELAKITQEAINQLGWDITVEKVTDMTELAKAGVLVTPAMSLDGKLLVSGKVPSVEEIKNLLSEEKSEEKQNPVTQEEKGCCCKATQPVEKPSCECDGACCSKESEQPNGKGWKKAIVWVVLIIILLAVVKLVNREMNDSVQTTTESNNTMQNGVELVYMEYGARCPTCIRMEKWAKETVENEFAPQLKDRSIMFAAVPAKEELVQKYNLTTKALILKVFRDGKEVSWIDLDKIWELSKDEAAFKSYVADSIRKQLALLK